MLSSIYDVLSDRLTGRVQGTEYDKVRIFVNPKELDSRILSWKGGAIFSRIESNRDHWISREEWLATGIRSIRDRAPFFW